MTGTVTHDISKYINNLIRPYLNEKFMVKSTDEFLEKLNNINSFDVNKIISLDAESLFTNASLSETINVILENVYYHYIKPPPSIEEDILRRLLYICTTKTPLSFNGETYI